MRNANLSPQYLFRYLRENVMSIRDGPFIAVSELQPAVRVAPGHSLQNSPRVQSQNFQQSRVRCAVITVSQSRVRGSLLPHQDVHHPHVIRQGGHVCTHLSCQHHVIASRAGAPSTGDRPSPAPPAGLSFILMVHFSGWTGSSLRSESLIHSSSLRTDQTVCI